ncbi:ester cyclase [Granulicella sp. dw_53]|uniref:ester cyclase n=1 Tax=Granulicella sp. dw_53 TaxID=2719792 RepID=UPI001BD43217|nr:ester cyclase [Granulicella sp. dw_53]
MSNATTSSVNQALLEVWKQHTYSEFVLKDAKAALSTMSDNPHVLMVPIALGGRGRDGVYNFYRNLFLSQLPADITSVPVSQAIAQDILVEESVYRFTHDQAMDWLIPDVPPTGKYVELATVSVVKFENAKIASEHVYWDHASVLAQLGVIESARIAAKDTERPRTLLERVGMHLRIEPVYQQAL